MRLYSSLLVLTLPIALGACSGAPSSSDHESTDSRFDPIIGGISDDNVAHDAVVMVYNAQVGAMCTGTLVSQNGEKGVVITARHCVSEVVSEYVTCKNDVADDYPASDLYIVRGVNPQHGADALLGTGEKIFHTPGTSLCNADFAVIVMQEKISGMLPLRVRVNPEAYQQGEKFTAIGYGLTNPNNDYSAGQRFLREGVTVTALGPKLGSIYAREFQGTTSICSGDSGGPAVSANWAVMGVTSRGASCYGNDNIWTRVDGFKDIIDEAMAYAGSSYVPEDGAPPWPGDIGGAGGTGGSGSGGSGGAGPDTTGGDDTPATGGAAGSNPPAPASCGDLGPCPDGSRCVTDASSGQSACVALCNTQVACPDGSSCDLEQGLCVASPAPANAMNEDVSATGGCAVGHGSASRGAGALVLAALAWFASRRRKQTPNPS